jgi:hypothetical protein
LQKQHAWKKEAAETDKKEPCSRDGDGKFEIANDGSFRNDETKTKNKLRKAPVRFEKEEPQKRQAT